MDVFLSVWNVHMNAGVLKGQKRGSDYLTLELHRWLRAACRGLWEQILGPLQEQDMLLAPEPSLQFPKGMLSHRPSLLWSSWNKQHGVLQGKNAFLLPVYWTHNNNDELASAENWLRGNSRH